MNLPIVPLHPNFKPPRFAGVGSASFDLHAVEDGICKPGEIVKVFLGFKVALSSIAFLMLSTRPSQGLKYGLRVVHGYEIIACESRGEVFITLTCKKEFSWKAGDRICRAIALPVLRPRFDLVESLPENYS